MPFDLDATTHTFTHTITHTGGIRTVTADGPSAVAERATARPKSDIVR
jgi:hypothetical protein